MENAPQSRSMRSASRADRSPRSRSCATLQQKLAAFYFAFGESDFYVLTDLPSHSAAVAISIAVNASGAVKARTVPLLTAQEIDAATQQGGVQYQAPGT